MQKTMTDPQFKTMDEAAQTLRISRRTLQDLIVKHPCYSVVGNRRKIFSHKNIKQLFEAMQCRSNSLSATDTPTSEWRTVAEFPNYEVSNSGKVRRFDVASKSYKVLNLGLSKNGYVRVTLYAGNGKVTQRYVHRLVCLAFSGDQPIKKPLACHYDGNKQNNSDKNLYWGSHKENTADAMRHGTRVTIKYRPIVIGETL
jgi:NUMOD4 motif/HNH endonuclease